MKFSSRIVKLFNINCASVNCPVKPSEICPMFDPNPCPYAYSKSSNIFLNTSLLSRNSILNLSRWKQQAVAKLDNINERQCQPCGSDNKVKITKIARSSEIKQ